MSHHGVDVVSPAFAAEYHVAAVTRLMPASLGQLRPWTAIPPAWMWARMKMSTKSHAYARPAGSAHRDLSKQRLSVVVFGFELASRKPACLACGADFCDSGLFCFGWRSFPIVGCTALSHSVCLHRLARMPQETCNRASSPEWRLAGIAQAHVFCSFPLTRRRSGLLWSRLFATASLAQWKGVLMLQGSARLWDVHTE